MALRDRRKRWAPKEKFFFSCFILAVVAFALLNLLVYVFSNDDRPHLISSWGLPAMQAVSGESPAIPLIRETVTFPDQSLLFLKYPPSSPLFTKNDMDCVYYIVPNSSDPPVKLPPVSVDGEGNGNQIVRCPLPPRAETVTLGVKSNGIKLPVGPAHRWDSLVYEALIDRDNSTVVFVKGLNLRPGRVSNASRFACVYGWDFTRRKFLLTSDVVSVAQEIVRCKTPLSVLSQRTVNVKYPIKVSIRVIGRGILKSIARVDQKLEPDPNPTVRKYHPMCVCTMLRNQARFMKEWVMYHSRVGVYRWFIYDNNSNDDIEKVIGLLLESGFNITRHVWPWIKTQEAGFAHCALRARESCEWVGFIDVDEFIYLPDGLSLYNVLNNESRPGNVGELRTSCYSFGPSGQSRVPVQGVTVGYTCRLSGTERHKSIVRPEALSSTLINVVHHFDLRDDYVYVNMDKNVMVINHYKYQVWEVFKDKFYRRVATYVSDWQQEENVGSKDRAPGLGTQPVEPPGWSSRFCEVVDEDLRRWVLVSFTDPKTGMLPWQDEEKGLNVVEHNRRRRRRRRMSKVL